MHVKGALLGGLNRRLTAALVLSSAIFKDAGDRGGLGNV